MNFVPIIAIRCQCSLNGLSRIEVSSVHFGFDSWWVRHKNIGRIELVVLLKLEVGPGVRSAETTPGERIIAPELLPVWMR